MAVEIERKFLVKPGAWTPRDAGTPFTQGYLVSQDGCVVRVRREGREAKLTIKGATTGISRLEFEYTIPEADAAVMLDQLCGHPLIEKHRHLERHGEHTWEIDVFHGDNDGLVVAEVELTSETDEPTRPAWLGDEVSGDPRYSNSNLRTHPFTRWR